MAVADIVNYVVFVVTLAVSMGIGLFHAFRGQRGTTDDYLLGGGQMRVLPVILSLAVTYISTVTIMGLPGDVYNFGAGLALEVLAIPIGVPISVILFLPIVYHLKCTSINEYLYARYQSRVISCISSASSMFSRMLIIGTIVFGPATAIDIVFGLPTWVVIIILCSVCIIYTTVGGFRGVIWTDVFQSVVMIAGMILIVIQGFVSSGGMKSVYDINKKWGRTDFFDFRPDPRLRLTFWSIMVGRGTSTILNHGFSQPAFQRVRSVSSYEKARRVILGVIPYHMFFAGMAFLMGWVVFAYYALQGCDPLASYKIYNINQIVPYFVMEAMNYPGVPGLFLASVTAASLSSASSTLNSSAANIYEDWILPFAPAVKQLSSAKKTFILKMIVAVQGVIGCGLSFLINYLRGTLLQFLYTFLGATRGPFQGLFLMGMFFPWIDWKGASFGAVVTFVIGTWMGMGSYVIGSHRNSLPSPVENCTYILTTNYTHMMHPQPDVATTTMESIVTSTALPDAGSGGALRNLYSVSFFYYPLFFPLLSIILGLLFSLIEKMVTGKSNIEKVDPALIHPWARKVARIADPYVTDDTDDLKKEDITHMAADTVKDGMQNPAYIPDVLSALDGEKTSDKGDKENGVTS